MATAPTKRPRMGGRAKGTPNKITRSTRELIATIVEGHIELFQEKFLELPAKEFCQVYLGLVKFVVPALQSVSVENSSEIMTSIETKLLDLTKPKG